MTPALRRASATRAILNVSSIMRGKVTKTASTDRSFRRESTTIATKRTRTEDLLLTSLWRLTAGPKRLLPSRKPSLSSYGCQRLAKQWRRSPWACPVIMTSNYSKRYWFQLNLFVHRNHKLNKQVQETQKQYAYLSVIYRSKEYYIYISDGKMANYC